MSKVGQSVSRWRRAPEVAFVRKLWHPYLAPTNRHYQPALGFKTRQHPDRTHELDNRYGKEMDVCANQSVPGEINDWVFGISGYFGACGPDRWMDDGMMCCTLPWLVGLYLLSLRTGRADSHRRPLTPLRSECYLRASAVCGVVVVVVVVELVQYMQGDFATIGRRRGEAFFFFLGSGVSFCCLLMYIDWRLYICCFVFAVFLLSSISLCPVSPYITHITYTSTRILSPYMAFYLSPLPSPIVILPSLQSRSGLSRLLFQWLQWVNYCPYYWLAPDTSSYQYWHTNCYWH